MHLACKLAILCLVETKNISHVHKEGGTESAVPPNQTLDGTH